MKKKNILFLTPSNPYPPDQGGSIRTWGQIQHLAKQHAVYLLSFSKSKQINKVCAQQVHLDEPQRNKINRLGTLLSGTEADLKVRLLSETFTAKLADLLTQHTFEGVHIEGLEMGAYIDTVRQISPHSKIVFDAFNAELLIQQRAYDTDKRNPRRWPHALYSRLQLPRIRKFEHHVCNLADHVLYVSPEDGVELRKHNVNTDFILVPNGIHVSNYSAEIPQNANPTLVYTGKMDYRPNVDAIVWFVNQILPHLKQDFPTLQVLIVGKSPTDAVKALGNIKGVTVTGIVPEIQPYMAQADVYIAPLRMGGGTRFKLLEAMAMARPIVSTQIGAEGFSATNGQEMVLADSVEAQVDAIRKLLNDKDEANAMGLRGRQFVEENFDWSVILPKLDELYAD